MFIHLCVVCGSFQGTTAELNSTNNDYSDCKAKKCVLIGHLQKMAADLGNPIRHTHLGLSVSAAQSLCLSSFVPLTNLMTTVLCSGVGLPPGHLRHL